MIIIVGASFVFLFIISLYKNKDIFKPSSLMLISWIIIFILYLALDHNLYKIHDKFPFAILLWVFFFFIFSSLFGFTHSNIQYSVSTRKPNRSILNIYYIIVIISMPFLIYKIVSLALNSEYFFLALRSINTGADAANMENIELGIIPYFITLSLVLYLIELINLTPENKKRVIILFVLNFLIAFISMAKISFFTLFFSTFIILYYKGKIKIKTIAIFLFVFLLFSFFLQNLRSLEGDNKFIDFISAYTLSGMVAFDYYTPVHNNQFGANTFRLFYALASSLGFKVKVSDTILNYIYIPTPTNVYTCLYPFYTDFSFAGIIIFASITGAFMGFLYKKSFTSKQYYCILYSIFSAFIVLQFIGEFLFTNLSTTIQYVFYTILPYIFSKNDRHTTCNI